MAGLITTTQELNASLTVYSGTDAETWLTDWMPCIAMDTVNATLKATNVSGAISIKTAVQFAPTRTDSPSSSGVVGSAVTATGEYFVSGSDFNMSASVPTNAFVRFGLAAHVTSTPNTGKANVTLQLSMLQLGSVMRPWTGHLVATSATKQFLPIGPWMPALSALKFQPTIVVSDLGGNLELNLTYRTATTSPETPDPWNTSGLLTPINMNSDLNYGEQAPTLTGKMWVQPGLYYDVTAGSLGQADVSVLLGVRHAT